MKLTVRMEKERYIRKWYREYQQVYLIYIMWDNDKNSFHLFFLLSHSGVKMSIHFFLPLFSSHFLAHSQNDKVIYEIAFDWWSWHGIVFIDSCAPFPTPPIYFWWLLLFNSFLRPFYGSRFMFLNVRIKLDSSCDWIYQQIFRLPGSPMT